ncbi:hypothetical protein G6F56_003084 [Rhizopus delemar]|uniref:C3H1-type domain-containing protein n=1 Tax=Rhizopus stolonifer TaxID=4846 RepID=A0A367KWU9_RHIST|nr:hypothetical protein G6F56_003084 [Rhizopus delemar]RCI06689.1 hypothetical protein CU098_013704 [Rhizopus stolonifer]
MSEPNLSDYSLSLLSKSSPSQPYMFKRSRTQSIPATSTKNNNIIPESLFDSSQKLTNNKQSNLSHVPCKFYKQGTCTAGANCTFSHSSDFSSEGSVCKYFMKGNCKFGTKCALLHTMSQYGTSAGTNGMKSNGLANSSTPPNLSFLGRRNIGDHHQQKILLNNDPFASSAPAVSLFNQQLNDSTLWRNQSPRTNIASADLIGLHSSPRESSDHLLFGSSSSSNRPYLQSRSSNNGYFSSESFSTISELNQRRPIPMNGKLNNNDHGFDLNDAMLPSSLNDLFTPAELQARRIRQQEKQHQQYSLSPTNSDWLLDNSNTQRQWRVPFLTKTNESILDYENRLPKSTTPAINIPGGNINHETSNNDSTIYSHPQDDLLSQDDEVQFFMEDDELTQYNPNDHKSLDMTNSAAANSFYV